MLSLLSFFSLIKHDKLTLKLLYTSLFVLALPFIVLRLIWRGFKAPAYWHRWSERFGASPRLSKQDKVIWVHAVSVGEVEACRPLVAELQVTFPDSTLLITTMTPTGSARVKLLFDDSVAHCYLPYDIPLFLEQFIARSQPMFGIIMETEIWPNLIFSCYKDNVPLLLANARLSVRSAKSYSRWSNFISSILQSLTVIAAQGEQDKQHFKQLGADENRLFVTGNLKYETSLAITNLNQQAQAMRKIWGQDRPVWIVASTHEGEETLIIEAFRSILKQIPTLLLIIVPRHPERFERVASLISDNQLPYTRRSKQETASADTQVLLIDTMGELPLFYACSDIAFVGGSLVEHGGHNLLEPAILAKAIITGPHFFNFTEITKQFLEADAAILVADKNELEKTVVMLLQDQQQCIVMGEAALEIIDKSQGASRRIIDLIKQYLL